MLRTAESLGILYRFLSKPVGHSDIIADMEITVWGTEGYENMIQDKSLDELSLAAIPV